MIQRITPEKYLKRFDNMTGKEKEAVMDKIGDWLNGSASQLLKEAELPEAHLRGVMQLSQNWDDTECGRWDEGVRLLTAFTGITDTWLPEHLYIKAARRTIRRMVEVLSEQYELSTRRSSVTPSENEPDDGTTSREQNNIPSRRKRGRPRKTQTMDDASSTAGQPATPSKLSAISTKTAIPRPRHIDQYIYLLPEKTQERAVQYGPLMRDLQTSRENMRLLMNDAHSNGSERERWAKTAVRIDEKITAIRKELDAEWSKIAENGHVIIDELGMAHLVNLKTGEISDPKPKAKKVKPKAKPDDESKQKRSHHKKMTEEEKAKRVEYLKKWLRDPRAAVTDERRMQWEQNCRELLGLGGRLTKSICKTGEHYGAKVPKV